MQYEKILGAEFVGMAKVWDGVINVGGVEIPWLPAAGFVARDDDWPIYVRRYSSDLRIAEIHIADHDGYAQDELNRQNEEAENHPLGPRAYWHSMYVGDQGWSEEEFADFWEE